MKSELVLFLHKNHIVLYGIDLVINSLKMLYVYDMFMRCYRQSSVPYLGEKSFINVCYRSQLENVSQSFDSLVSRVPTMHHIAKLFCDPGSDKANAFNDVLFFLSDEVTQKSSDFKTWMETSLPSETEIIPDSCDTESVKEFSEDVEELMSAVLMVIQKLKKQHVRDSEGVEKSVDEGTLS